MKLWLYYNKIYFNSFIIICFRKTNINLEFDKENPDEKWGLECIKTIQKKC